MKMIVALIIMLLGLTTCDIDIPEPDAYLRKQVVFSAQRAEEQNLGIFTNTPINGYWNPSEIEINDMFVTLVKYLQSTDEDQNIGNLENYRHQHFGYISADKQYIYNNYFCDNFDTDVEWRTTFISVSDGGNCFFQAIFDVSNQEIINLYINGES